MSFLRHLLLGAVAGSAGTAALNIATYADMTARGRPPSEVPSKMVKLSAQAAGLGALTSDDEATENRRSGIGALLGYANGLGVGIAYGALRPALRRVPLPLAAIAVAGAIMALSDVPIAKSGAGDPSTWSAADWVADAVPHLAYGVALALTFDALG